MKMKCDCDAFSDAPCPSHGYGSMECECGARVRAPLVVRNGWELMCTCRRRYVGAEDAAHGYWKPMQAPSVNKAMAWPEQPKRVYPTCVCGAWLLGVVCEFCSRKRST